MSSLGINQTLHAVSGFEDRATPKRGHNTKNLTRHGSEKKTGRLPKIGRLSPAQIERNRELNTERVGDEISRLISVTGASEAHIDRLCGGTGRLKNALHRLRYEHAINLRTLFDLALATNHEVVVTFKERTEKS